MFIAPKAFRAVDISTRPILEIVYSPQPRADSHCRAPTAGTALGLIAVDDLAAEHRARTTQPTKAGMVTIPRVVHSQPGDVDPSASSQDSSRNDPHRRRIDLRRPQCRRSRPLGQFAETRRFSGHARTKFQKSWSDHRVGDPVSSRLRLRRHMTFQMRKRSPPTAAASRPTSPNRCPASRTDSALTSIASHRPTVGDGYGPIERGVSPSVDWWWL